VDRIIVINEGRIIADMSPDDLVSSSILSEIGIREPLYITALKYAGITVRSDMNPSNLDRLKMDTVAGRLKSWHKSIEKPVKRRKDLQSLPLRI